MINERFDLQFRVELEAILVFHEQTIVGQLRQLHGKPFEFDQKYLHQYSKEYLRKRLPSDVREYMSQPAYREYGRPKYTGWGIKVVEDQHNNPRGEHVRYSKSGKTRTYGVEHLELARRLLRSPAPNHNNPGNFGSLYPDALEIDLYDGNTRPIRYKNWHLTNDFSLVGLYDEQLRAYLERHKVCEDYPRTMEITMNQPTLRPPKETPPIAPKETPVKRTVWKSGNLPTESYPSTPGSYKTPPRGPEFSPITPDELSGQSSSGGNRSSPFLRGPLLRGPFETPARRSNKSRKRKSSSTISVTGIEQIRAGVEGPSNNPIVLPGKTTKPDDPDATVSVVDAGVTQTKAGGTGSASSRGSNGSGSKRKAGNNFRYETPKRVKTSDPATGVDDYNVANIIGRLGLAQLNPSVAGSAIGPESTSSNQAATGPTVTQSRLLRISQGAGVEKTVPAKDKGKRKANDQGEADTIKKIKLFEPVGPRRIDVEEWDSHGIELVSNVLRPVEESFSTISELCRRLKGGCCDLLGATTNEFCGLHVHVKPARGQFDLKTLQHLVYMLVIFEEPLDKLFPMWRRVSIENFLSERDFRSNRGRWRYEPADPKAEYKYWQYDEASGTMKDIDGKHKFRSPVDIACDIFGTESVMGLRELIPGGKEQVVSFDNIGLRPKDKVQQTVEFRQHEGVTDGLMVKWWVMFCVGLVRLAEQRAQESAGADVEMYVQALRYGYHNWNDNVSVWDLFDMMDFPAEGVQYFERKAAYHANPAEQVGPLAISVSGSDVDNGGNGGNEGQDKEIEPGDEGNEVVTKGKDVENVNTTIESFQGGQPASGGYGLGIHGSPKSSGGRARGDEEKNKWADDGEKSPPNSLDPSPTQSPEPPPSQSSYGSGGPVNTPSPDPDVQDPDNGGDDNGGDDNDGDDDSLFDDSSNDDDDNDHPDEIPLPAPQIDPTTGEPVGGRFSVHTTSSLIDDDGDDGPSDIPLPEPQIKPTTGEPVGGRFSVLATSSVIDDNDDDNLDDIPLPAPRINPVTGEPVGGHFNILASSSFTSQQGVGKQSPLPGLLAGPMPGPRDPLQDLLASFRSTTSGNVSSSSKENKPIKDNPPGSVRQSTSPILGRSTRISYLPTPNTDDPKPPSKKGHDDPTLGVEEEEEEEEEEDDDDDDDVIPSIEVDDDDWIPVIEEDDDDEDDDVDIEEETDEDDNLITTSQHPATGTDGGADPVTPTGEASPDLPGGGLTFKSQALSALTLSTSRRQKRRQMGLKVTFKLPTPTGSETASEESEEDSPKRARRAAAVQAYWDLSAKMQADYEAERARSGGEYVGSGGGGEEEDEEQASRQLLGSLQAAAGVEMGGSGVGVGGTEDSPALDDRWLGSDSEDGDMVGM